jgi:putative redox protein
MEEKLNDRGWRLAGRVTTGRDGAPRRSSPTIGYVSTMADETAPPRKGPSRIRATWVGDHRFDAGRPGGPTARIDSAGKTGQSPMDAMLTALATCSAVDVEDILVKRRTPVQRMVVDVTAERAPAVPARVVRVILTFEIDGPGIDRRAAERAIDLALGKYCSVRASLDPATPIEFSLTLNGESGRRVESRRVTGAAPSSSAPSSATPSSAPS